MVGGSEILPRLGIGTGFLRNRHGPCPICGGRDRYRFDDRDGEGTYFCNQCGAGSGIILVRKLHGWDFKTACDEIDKIIGSATPETWQPSPARDDEQDRAKRKSVIERALRAAQAPDVVTGYLRRRGLGVVPKSLQGHPALWHSEARCSFPAVLAPILGPSGDLQSVQRIYVGDVTPRKMTLPPIDTIKGGAVRLFRPPTCLASAKASRPAWPATSFGAFRCGQPSARAA